MTSIAPGAPQRPVLHSSSSSAKTPSEQAPRVALVGAGPGDPELLTIKALRRLEAAQVVLYDHLVSPLILSLCAPTARMIDVGKIPGGKATAQEVINALLVKEARGGALVVRLKGGDPFVFGRGGEEALALAEAGIGYEIVPGISSSTSVPALAGIPVTHREVATHFTVITGMSARDVTQELAASWRALAQAGGTLVFLMGVRTMPQIVARLIDGGLSATTPAAIIERGACPEQRIIVTTLAELVQARDAHEVGSPAIIVVGQVVALSEQIGAGMGLERQVERWMAQAI